MGDINCYVFENLLLQFVINCRFGSKIGTKIGWMLLAIQLFYLLTRSSQIGMSQSQIGMSKELVNDQFGMSL
jgi:hypothetical protein